VDTFFATKAKAFFENIRKVKKGTYYLIEKNATLSEMKIGLFHTYM
jgi:hypothetical protein